jgi:hypothetical protein
MVVFIGVNCWSCSEDSDITDNPFIIAGSTTACPIIEIVAANYLKKHNFIIITHRERS